VRASSSLVLDGQTLLNLEIFQNTMDNTAKGTLFKLLDHSQTPFGKRIFKKWVCHPLQSVTEINARLDAVEDLSKISSVMVDVQKRLKKLPDIERIIARIHTGTCKVKDFTNCLAALNQIPVIGH
jgi:DNA mismatch repair protein MSH6